MMPWSARRPSDPEPVVGIAPTADDAIDRLLTDGAVMAGETDE
jgi:hypothetical protein